MTHSKREVVHVRVGEEYSDKASTVLPLVGHKIQCNIIYPIVQIVSTMTFRNEIAIRDLGGELIMPLPEGASVFGYAMQVDGELIDAVPVEKETSKKIFESEVRAHKQVSVAEKVDNSNCFKTQVYPLVYGQDKVIRVKYQMVMKEIVESGNKISGSAWLPLSYPDFNLLRDASIEFLINESASHDFDTNIAMKMENGEKLIKPVSNSSIQRLEKSDFDGSMTGFSIEMSRNVKSTDNILFATENDYFMVSVPVSRIPEELKSKSIGDRVQIIWDVSLSQSDHHEENLNLLKLILNRLENDPITLSLFSNTLVDHQEFDSKASLLNFVKSSLVYDGASNMKLFGENLISSNVDYCIAFTNGIHNFGLELTPKCTFEKPIFFVNTSPITNSQLLKNIAVKSGGAYLNANETNIEKLLDIIGKPQLLFLVADYESCDMEEVYPHEPVGVEEGEVFRLFGKIKNSNNSTASVGVSFKYGSKIIQTQEINIPTTRVEVSKETAIVPHLWAQEKIKCLSPFPQLFMDEIKKTSQEFSVVTESTSLLVLESLGQYIKYNIMPPETLPKWREAFLESQKQKEASVKEKEKKKLKGVLSKWKLRTDWHRVNFDMATLKRIQSKKKRGRPSRDSVSASIPESSNDDRVRNVNSDGKRKRMKSIDTSPSSPIEGSITITPWTPKAAYYKAITTSQDPYMEYLNQRKSYKDSPAFYFDVADYLFTKQGNKTLAIRILSNIVELELENAELYRIIGYRLDQADELELAEYIFEKVKKMNPFEPQSFRDLALIKERLGKYEEAMHLFNKVIVGKWDERFSEIELTVALEMNHLLLKDPKLPIVDNRLIYNFDLDIRISMAWDTDMVDLDLHVEEPQPYGEHAYYGHPNTRIKGLVSRDFREGYGPEEYMIKKAQPGDYIATTNFFANHSQGTTGGTTVLCTFYLNYMRPNEQRHTSTIRISSHKENIQVCKISIDE